VVVGLSRSDMKTLDRSAATKWLSGYVALALPLFSQCMKVRPMDTGAALGSGDAELVP
jgi:hypothetical protein